jgi:hypothetical protein
MLLKHARDLRFFLFWLLFSLLSQYKKEKSNKRNNATSMDERQFNQTSINKTMRKVEQNLCPRIDHPDRKHIDIIPETLHNLST